MTRPARSQTLARRRALLSLEGLETRQMLNASPVAGHAASVIHAEVKHPATHAASKTVHAAVVASHVASKTAHPTAAKPTAHASAAASGKTIKVHSKLLDISVVNGSPTINPNDPSQVTYAPVVGAYNPTQLQTAYGVNLLGLANQGQGVTIGIVDEFDDTAITGDANAYSAQYNLPQFNASGGPILSVVLDSALGTVTSAVGTGVAAETSLDVEMAHAMAPRANILLVEVPATGSVANEFAELLHGGQVAAGSSVNGTRVVVVSTSYGYPEGSIGNANVVALNTAYLTSGASTTVPMTFSTGDGSTPLFPATSPNVIGVGGTSLYLGSARGRYNYETAWGGLSGEGAGGGGTSTNFGPPSFQTSNGVVYATRAIPDISMNADPVTGASVYDSLDETASAPSPWDQIGGTSEASPLFAGVLALTQQQRIAAGQPILNSVQVNTAVYEAYTSPAYSTYFHDITLGKNSNVNTRGRTTVTGYVATTGYDLATGVGSPIANTLVPYLTNYVIGT